MVKNVFKNAKNSRLKFKALSRFRKIRIEKEKIKKEEEKEMKINCKNVSNRGNGGNCKISPKNPLSQSCTFSRECSELNNSHSGTISIKRLNDCYAKTYEHDYWQERIVPQVQEKLNSLDKHKIKENKKKEKIETWAPP